MSETNRYARQKLAGNNTWLAKWHDVTRQELKAYFGICLVMGINNLPRLAMYWSSDPLIGNTGIQNIMTKNRFEELRACSHGGGGPQVGEVPRLGGVTNLSIQSLFFSWLLSHERWGTSPRRVARSAVPGNPLRWGKFSPCECWRWGGVMFSWAFIHYKTNWKADRTAKNVKFNAQYFG